MEVLSVLQDRKKIGRPTINPKTTRLGVRLPEEEMECLENYCKRKGLKKSEVIRLAIKEYLEKEN